MVSAKRRTIRTGARINDSCHFAHGLTTCVTYPIDSDPSAYLMLKLEANDCKRQVVRERFRLSWLRNSWISLRFLRAAGEILPALEGPPVLGGGWTIQQTTFIRYTGLHIVLDWVN